MLRSLLPFQPRSRDAQPGGYEMDLLAIPAPTGFGKTGLLRGASYGSGRSPCCAGTACQGFVGCAASIDSFLRPASPPRFIKEHKGNQF
jgi:hypothetical protein